MQVNSGSRKKEEKKSCFKERKQNQTRILVIKYKEGKELLKMTPVSDLGDWKFIVLCQNTAYGKGIQFVGEEKFVCQQPQFETMQRSLLLKDAAVRAFALDHMVD